MYYDWTLSIATAGPRLWNSLSVHLRQPDLSLGQFWWALKTRLFVAATSDEVFPVPCINILTYLLTYCQSTNWQFTGEMFVDRWYGNKAVWSLSTWRVSWKTPLHSVINTGPMTTVSFITFMRHVSVVWSHLSTCTLHQKWMNDDLDF